MASAPRTPSEILKATRIARGFRTAAAAADHFGLNKPTYSSHENGGRNLKAIPREAAKKYAKAYAIDASLLIGLAQPTQLAVDSTNVLIKLGSCAVGVWREGQIMDQHSKELYVPVPTAGKAYVEITDDSVDIVFRPGDVAIVEMLAHGAMPENGRLVFIERIRDGLTERSIRRVSERTETTAKLMLHAKRSGQALDYPSKKRDETIRLVAVVIAKYQAL